MMIMMMISLYAIYLCFLQLFSLRKLTEVQMKYIKGYTGRNGLVRCCAEIHGAFCRLQIHQMQSCTTLIIRPLT